jgi:hypothetical protein
MDGNGVEHGHERRLSVSRMRRLSASKVESTESGDETKRKLAEMGYEQELKRSLTMISILGLSFAIIAVPFVSEVVCAWTNGRDFLPRFTLD